MKIKILHSQITLFLVLLAPFYIFGQTLLVSENNNTALLKSKNYPISENSNEVDNASIPPSRILDLSEWSLSEPSDVDRNRIADQINEQKLNSGYRSKYFYTSKDGGIVFKCPVKGYKTSSNTTYTRVELREMLRAGNTSIPTKGPTKNNWVLRSSRSIKEAGGYDGQLKATLSVNHVTTTGHRNQVGRVIIGQIHAKNDEPMRLYYRKLPNNRKGSVYFIHENKTIGKDEAHELIGSKSDSASNPHNGIALDEKFSYDVTLVGNLLTVRIIRPNKPVVQKTIDIRKSNYDEKDEYMYFKAGVYNQNKTGEDFDYVQATFYALDNMHKKYKAY